MPELPEVEAWVRELDPLVSRAPVAVARPGHVATLKTFDPPPAALEGRTFQGARRRGKNLLFPTADGELDLTEAGKKKRAGVWILTPDALDAELAHLGPDALDVDAAQLAGILRRERRQLHPLLRDQRALAGIGRAHANEILWEARLSPFRLSTELDDAQVATLARAVQDDLGRALELRLAGKGDADVYRVHGHFGEPCPRCGEVMRRVDFEEHTITYCPSCQTGGRILKDRRLSRLLR